MIFYIVLMIIVYSVMVGLTHILASRWFPKTYVPNGAAIIFWPISLPSMIVVKLFGSQ